MGSGSCGLLRRKGFCRKVKYGRVFLRRTGDQLQRVAALPCQLEHIDKAGEFFIEGLLGSFRGLALLYGRCIFGIRRIRAIRCVHRVGVDRIREQGQPESTPHRRVVVKLAYRNRNGEPKQWPPKVLLVVEDSVTELDEESVDCIDYAWIDRVNVVLNKYESDRGKSLYIKTLEVFQRVEDDPILARHARRGQAMHDPDDDANFNPENDEDLPN